MKSFVIGAYLTVLCGFGVYAQSDKQRDLETRRTQLQEEIQQINNLLFKNKTKEKSQLSTIVDLNYKIEVQRNLIKVTNQQANLISSEINTNQNKITALRNELKNLKDAYADMLVKSYKSKNEESRLMFLLSSNSFKQVYKRAQYLQQYQTYQKQQGESIISKTEELQALNKELSIQKQEKDKLIAQNRTLQRELNAELAQHEKIMSTIKRDLNTYASQVRQKQREADELDKEIERLIKAAIAESNKDAGKSTSLKSFSLTPEAKALADNFEKNKGKLPWPVARGVITLGYGKQPSPIDSRIQIQSNGVRISTEQNAEVRAVFNGNVYAIMASKFGNPTVLIQHGNYFTVYKNLAKVSVKKGEKVSTNQPIGQVFTNASNGESILNFSVIKNTDTQNPKDWIVRQ